MSLLPRSRAKRAAIAAALLLACAPALAIKPFSADYQASYKGLESNGRMTLVAQGGNRWKYTLSIGGGGVQLNQSTVFEDNGGQWRPLSGTDSSLLLIKKSSKNASYDWSKGVATWSGDVKPERAGPVALQAGDLDALLINLALARDVGGGHPLNYRMVDDGRVKQLDYQVAGKDSINVGGRQKEATKVVHNDGNKQITVWVVAGLPVPARILQRRNGKDDIDLQIKSIN